MQFINPPSFDMNHVGLQVNTEIYCKNFPQKPRAMFVMFCNVY